MLEKNEIRNQIKKVRTLLCNKSALDTKIFENIIKSDIYKNSKSVLLYVSTEYEVDTYRLIERALNDNKTVAVPVSDFTSNTMCFHIIKSLKDLTRLNHGISEPEVTADKLSSYDSSLCIVPAFVYDKMGYRVGYGKGFYDRFLSEFSGTSLGICYECFLWKQLDVETNDIPVDYIITENGVKLQKSEPKQNYNNYNKNS